MDNQLAYTKGDRVRLRCACPGAQAGDEGTVISICCPHPEREVTLTILIDGDPATVHGIVAFEHEVEPVEPTP